MIIDKLRRASQAVYLATEEKVAKDLSDLLLSAASEIEKLIAERDEALKKAKLYDEEEGW